MDETKIYVAIEGDMRLRDMDRCDDDERTCDRHYCISHKSKDGKNHDMMVIWRRGETVRSESIGHDPEYGLKKRDIMDFAKCLMKAHELLGVVD